MADGDEYLEISPEPLHGSVHLPRNLISGPIYFLLNSIMLLNIQSVPKNVPLEISF